jgi:hypothetical protein
VPRIAAPPLAVVHVDQTGRIQTLTEAANGRFYTLVKKFFERTGVPIILNTSFNVMGEPIVESPQDAISSFLSTDIDYLVIENLLLKKRNILFGSAPVPTALFLRGWQQRLRGMNLPAAQPFGDMEAQAPQAVSKLDCIGTFDNAVFGRISLSVDRETVVATHIAPGPGPGGQRSLELEQVGSTLFRPLGARAPWIALLPYESGEIDYLAVSEKDSLETHTIFRRNYAVGAGIHTQDLIGEYVGRHAKINVFAHDGRLNIQAEGQVHFELAHYNQNKFALKQAPGHFVKFDRRFSGPGADARAAVQSNRNG